jgi:phosphoglycolate phosphatase-like HAD superfamily hydrolase
MKKIKAVIFDLDGTIGDTVPLCIKAFRESVEPLIKKAVSDSDIMATFGPSEEGTIMALAPNHYEKGIADYLSYYEIYHDICPRPFEGIKELLDLLKKRNIHLAMVTGKGKYSTEISLKKFDLENYFEIIETGVSSGPRKPEGLRNVINKYGELSKGEMIYIGDAISDIEASRQVAIPVVAAGWAVDADREKLIAHQPDEIFHSVSDLSKWLITMI